MDPLEITNAPAKDHLKRMATTALKKYGLDVHPENALQTGDQLLFQSRFPQKPKNPAYVPQTGFL
ncbi:hypothetical protein [Negadavirga shengliensis]|uniref:Uncharacterized protein n=1 Tax=Negadavirga shengliensis TaxID=1389218 RepID=A0ABV9T5A6_9BACT